MAVQTWVLRNDERDFFSSRFFLQDVIFLKIFSYLFRTFLLQDIFFKSFSSGNLYHPKIFVHRSNRMQEQRFPQWPDQSLRKLDQQTIHNILIREIPSTWEAVSGNILAPSWQCTIRDDFRLNQKNSLFPFSLSYWLHASFVWNNSYTKGNTYVLQETGFIWLAFIYLSMLTCGSFTFGTLFHFIFVHFGLMEFFTFLWKTYFVKKDGDEILEVNSKGQKTYHLTLHFVQSLLVLFNSRHHDNMWLALYISVIHFIISKVFSDTFLIKIML